MGKPLEQLHRQEKIFQQLRRRCCRTFKPLIWEEVIPAPLTTAGGVKCWGDNYYGQLGNGATVLRPTPVDVSGLGSGIIVVSAGSVHTCALTSEGGVKCWGDNGSGQLGDGTTIDRHTPVDVSGLSSGVVAISAGGYHTCALTSGGGMKCWGRNSFGQLGDGTYTKGLTPTDVSGLSSGINSISAGDNHTCALTSDGAVKCWGWNSSGQLGNGTTTDQNTPTGVFGLDNGITAISVGYQHTCALTIGGGVKCWGRNRFGQLGDGTIQRKTKPVNVCGLSGVTDISAGGEHTCALTSDGAVKCWGYNINGQLGNGTTTNRNTPTDVIGMTSGIDSISAGSRHTCALTSEGGVKCWGGGVLGDGNWSSRQPTPVDVVLLDMLIFRSIGAQDGYIWESTETSGVGLRANTTDTTFRVGDDNQNRQYRAILSFNTSPLPDNAVIHIVVLRLHYQRVVGFSTTSPLKVDIRTPFFGASVALLPSDFQATPSRANVASLRPSGNYHWITLNSTANPYVNLAGRTQIRLRYKDDDNDNMSADYEVYYSGNAQLDDRPELLIEYYIP
jgi:alpha-tubulin suppressor-like RCC1 family protein